MKSAPAPSAEDRATEVEYLKFVADHHFLGAKMAGVAVERARNDLLEKEAEQSEATQLRQIATIRTWLKEWYDIDYQPELDAEGRRMLEGLRTVEGGAFDVEFSETFIDHHLQVVERSLEVDESLFHAEADNLAEQIVWEQGPGISTLGKVLQIYPPEADASTEPLCLSQAEQKSQEIEYLKFVADHHTMGVEMADIAEDKAERPWLRDLAGRAKTDQAEEIGQVLTWLDERYGIDYQPVLDAASQQELARLRGLSRGAEFDTEFSAMFAMHHSQIVSRSNAAVDQVFSDDAEALAEHIIVEQGQEIGDLGAVLLSYPRGARA